MENDINLKIEYVPIELLTPYEKNARHHEEYDVNFIKNSIKSFGMCDPIGVWSDKNIIVEGHGRLAALKELGYKEVPIIRLDHLTDKQRKAYALAHNKTAEKSNWDYELLDLELNELTDDFNFADFGFDNTIIDDEYEPELKEHNNSSEKEITCPYCGGKILI